MSKICPLSMGGEPTECCKEDCNSFVNGDCFLNNISLSLYFISKNMQNIQQDMENMSEDLEMIRKGR